MLDTVSEFAVTPLISLIQRHIKGDVDWLDNLQQAFDAKALQAADKILVHLNVANDMQNKDPECQAAIALLLVLTSQHQGQHRRAEHYLTQAKRLIARDNAVLMTALHNIDDSDHGTQLDYYTFSNDSRYQRSYFCW